MKRFARFLRLKAFSVNPDFDVIALPTVMIHKGGQLVHNLTKILDHLPKRFGVNDVTELLESCGVVDPVSAGSTILRTSALKATCTVIKIVVSLNLLAERNLSSRTVHFVTMILMMQNWMSFVQIFTL